MPGDRFNEAELAVIRRAFARQMMALANVWDERVGHALATVRREDFLGAEPWQAFLRIAVPSARSGFVTGTILTFAHTVGEFGVVLMIGGNIPGATKVLSVVIYDFVERGDWLDAHWLSAGMVAFAFVVVTLTMLLDRRFGRLTG